MGSWEKPAPSGHPNSSPPPSPPLRERTGAWRHRREIGRGTSGVWIVVRVVWIVVRGVWIVVGGRCGAVSGVVVHRALQLAAGEHSPRAHTRRDGRHYVHRSCGPREPGGGTDSIQAEDICQRNALYLMTNIVQILLTMNADCLWSLGTGFSRTLPSVVISTVDHP
jgi:hypothetical protein